jgi:hypothetical protein
VAGERGIEVELPKGGAAIADRENRKTLEVFEKGLGFRSAVRLDVANNDFVAKCLLRMGSTQHGVGLAHAGRVTEKYPELSACGAMLFVADTREQGIGVGPLVVHDSNSPLYCTFLSGQTSAVVFNSPQTGTPPAPAKSGGESARGSEASFWIAYGVEYKGRHRPGTLLEKCVAYGERIEGPVPPCYIRALAISSCREPD